MIGQKYNDNKGSEQPTISRHGTEYTSGNGYGNALPQCNANNWELGLNEDSVYKFLRMQKEVIT